jgi:hypothetical protein
MVAFPGGEKIQMRSDRLPPAPSRYTISPDPPDGFVDITDIVKMTGVFGKNCAP